MSEIQIIEQGNLPECDGHWAQCAYDDTARRFRVSIDGNALIRLKQFEVSLTDLFEMAVLFALRSGQREGEVPVTARNPAERHLELIFQTRQEEAGHLTHPRILSLWLNNQVIEIRQVADGYEYRSEAGQAWEPGTPPGVTEMQVALHFVKTT